MTDVADDGGTNPINICNFINIILNVLNCFLIELQNEKYLNLEMSFKRYSIRTPQEALKEEEEDPKKGFLPQKIHKGTQNDIIAI